MKKANDYYTRLGVTKDASDREIKKAYHKCVRRAACLRVPGCLRASFRAERCVHSRLALKWHPDKHDEASKPLAGPPLHTVQHIQQMQHARYDMRHAPCGMRCMRAEKKFRLIAEAYDVLGKPKARQEYDSYMGAHRRSVRSPRTR